MAILLISFTTRPGEGSEGGVGWSFLLASAITAAAQGTELHAIIDERDERPVRAALAMSLVDTTTITIHAVAIPAKLASRFGMSRSRGSYLAWYPVALTTAIRLNRRIGFGVVHQVTFASATLPPVFPAGIERKIWGPIAVASQPIKDIEGKSARKSQLQIALTTQIGRLHSRLPDVCLVQNNQTAQNLRSSASEIRVEPNIVIEPSSPSETSPGLLTFAGNLIERKRPWLLLQALQSDLMGQYTAEFIGDGPLRGPLVQMAQEMGLADRVHFHGRLTRDETIDRIAKSMALFLPSSREGAPWVVGEAAARGVPSVVSDISGAGTVVSLSGNMGVEVTECTNVQDTLKNYRAAIDEVSRHTNRTPTSRWSADRLPDLLSDLWRR